MNVPYQLLRAARVALDVTHEDLCREAGVSERTLVRIETPQSVSAASLARVQSALEARGVVFLAGDGDTGPGFRVPGEALVAPAARPHEPGRKTTRKGGRAARS